VEVLPNHTYHVEHSGQVSVQSEQCLKPYHASPDAVGQAPPLLEPNRQPNHRGWTTQPREVEIVVPREADREQAALLEQLEQQQRQERHQLQAPGPPPLSGEDTPTRVTGEGGPPLFWQPKSHWHYKCPLSQKGARESEDPPDIWQTITWDTWRCPRREVVHPVRVKTPSLSYRIAPAVQDFSNSNNPQTSTVTWTTSTQLFRVMLAKVGGDTPYP